ncbi:MAG TPA: hypothetical protein VGB55_11725, partial [Tepidisphaeraceae bacterium]
MLNRTLLISAVVATLASAGFAQDQGPRGLDALTEDRLLNELAKRNLTPLLERAFENNRTPAEKRNAVQASSALTRLARDKEITLVEQRTLVANYVKALPQLLPTLTDATSIISDANILIDHGILTDQRLLEYFGPNATIMSRLKPVAKATQQMMARAQEAADKAAVEAQKNWPEHKAAWERADQQMLSSEYTRNILSYSAALATDPADAAREETLASAIEYLSQYDTEENPDRADVKFYIAKLNLVRGTKESLAAAKSDIAFVIANGKPENISQQFDSRLAAVVAEIALKNPPGAKTALDALTQWTQQAKIDKDADVQVAQEAMKYRITVAQADAAKDDEQKKLASAADDILDDLQQSRPDLRGLILELMAVRVKPDAPVKDLNNLLLQSLLAKAEVETIKPDGEAFDKQVVERGVQAAEEIIRRNIKTGTVTQTAAGNLGFFQKKLGNNAEAAEAFLNYIDKHKDANKEVTEIAFNNAIALVGNLYKAQTSDPKVMKLYERVLATAVAPPFERMAFAYEYARRLQANGKVEQAIAMYKKVPADSEVAGEAQYFTLLGVHQQLQRAKSDDPKRGGLLKELQTLADQVNASLQKKLTDASAQQKVVLNTRLAQTRLLAADVALRDQKQPQRAVELLNNFEAGTKGLANENDLLGQVLLIRVQSYVQLGKVSEATNELVKLAQQNPAATGQIVYNLLTALEEQINTAQAANRADEVARLEGNRAMLTPFLVEWSKNSTDPAIKKNEYTYSVFDADTQRRAAETVTDPTKRTSLLDASLKRFQELDSKESQQKFLALQPPERRAKMQYDPQVKIGLARVHFAREEWKEARTHLSRLFYDKVLGTGILTTPNPAGGVDSKDNPTYWEALFKLIRSNLSLNENVDAMKGLVREQQIIYGNEVGGQR